MAALSLDTVVSRRDEPLTARVDDDLVMLDPAKSRYFGLDPIGRRVWELLDQPKSVEQLCAELEGEFEVSPAACRTDVLALLEQLAEADLVSVR